MSNSSKVAKRQLKVADTARIQLLQLTDCHILATPEQRLQGMDTRQSLDAVLTAAVADSGRFDLLLATGDLSQDGSHESYRYLGSRLASLDLPVFWLPGNHDDIACMHQHLSDPPVFSDKLIEVGRWIILMLNSTVPGEVHGFITASELEFVDAALGENPDRHALVCLHHQAVDTGSEWIDLKGLRNNRQLRKRLRAHDNLRGVVWGHVHQEAQHQIGAVLWMSTPSSCVQFKPGSKKFAIDDAPPGYRSITLHADGSIDTAVHRVAPAWIGRTSWPK